MYYNLSTSMSDRINFDEMVERAAAAMLQTLDTETAMIQDPQQYAEMTWDEWFDVADQVDDVKEARARYISAFAEAVRSWQADEFSGA